MINSISAQPSLPFLFLHSSQSLYLCDFLTFRKKKKNEKKRSKETLYCSICIIVACFNLSHLIKFK